MTESMNKTVVINATNLGKSLDGIGTYTLNIVRELAHSKTSLNILVYINRCGAVHCKQIHFPDNVNIVQVSGLLSPDHGFRGHLLRLLFANYLGICHPRKLILVLSQLEAIFLRRNQVVMIHDLIPLSYKSCHKKQYPYFKYILPLTLRRAKAILTPSEHTRGLLRTSYGIDPGKVTVIPHGISEEFFEQSGIEHSSERPYILFLGRMTQMKNLDGIMRAFAFVQHTIPHNLVLVGQEKEKGERFFSTRELERYGVDTDRIIVKGYLATDAMVDILRRASLLAFPSLCEGFGLPAIEAMAVGCPVVASNVGSLPEVCGEAALYIDPHNPRSIADGMHRVLTDHALRQWLISEGLRLVRKYSWEKSFASHLQVIEDLTVRMKPAPSPEAGPRSTRLIPESLSLQ